MQDEVDRLIEAWQRERPDLDYDSLAVLSRVSRLARHLDRARKATFAAHQLEAYEFDVLTALRRTGSPFEMSPGELIAQTLVSSGTMTNRIDRLERRGYVERRPDPYDGRGVRVRLTARGRHQIDGAFAELLEREAALLGDLTPRQRSTVAAALRVVLAPFDS
jgi:DNA-binding MarR family transcriptional regulator